MVVVAYRAKYLGQGEYWVFGHRFAAGQERVITSDAEADYLRRLGTEERPLFRVEELAAAMEQLPEVPTEPAALQGLPATATVSGGAMTTADLPTARKARSKRGR